MNRITGGTGDASWCLGFLLGRGEADSMVLPRQVAVKERGVAAVLPW